jgi:hypothetical protein
VHAIPFRIAWRPAVRCLEWEVLLRFAGTIEEVSRPLEVTPQLSVKLRTSFASVLVRALCSLSRTVDLLGPFDDEACAALGFDRGAFRADASAQVKKLAKVPHVFRDIDSWHIETLRGTATSIWAPVAILYESMMGTVGGGAQVPKIAQLDISMERRTLFCNAEPVDWTCHPPSLFLSPEEVGRLSSFASVGRVRTGLRTTIFAMLSAEGMEAVLANGCINTFVRAHKRLVDLDVRLFSGVVQGVTHIYAGLWCVGQFTQCEGLRTLEPPKSPPVTLPRSVDGAWRAISRFGVESAFRRYRVEGRDDDFIDVFLRDVLWSLTSGNELSRRPLTLRVAYLPPIGWICAYIMLRRACFADFGPSVDLDVSIFTRLSHPAMSLFRRGFDVILSLDAVLATLSLDEFCDVLRKRAPH